MKLQQLVRGRWRVKFEGASGPEPLYMAEPCFVSKDDKQPLAKIRAWPLKCQPLF